jgi:hypothetical protein
MEYKGHKLGPGFCGTSRQRIRMSPKPDEERNRDRLPTSNDGVEVQKATVKLGRMLADFEICRRSREGVEGESSGWELAKQGGPRRGRLQKKAVEINLRTNQRDERGRSG